MYDQFDGCHKFFLGSHQDEFEYLLDPVFSHQNAPFLQHFLRKKFGDANPEGKEGHIKWEQRHYVDKENVTLDATTLYLNKLRTDLSLKSFKQLLI